MSSWQQPPPGPFGPPPSGGQPTAGAPPPRGPSFAVPTGPAAPKSGTSPWVYLIAGCGGLTLLGGFGMCAFLLVLGGGNEGGVRYANTMEEYAVDYNREHAILEPGEQIVAYYDTTIDLDASESAVLTDRRLVYHRAGVNTVIPVADIVDVQSTEDPLLGILIDVTGRDGSLMHIEIAHLNGGDGFLRLLRERAGQNAGALNNGGGFQF